MKKERPKPKTLHTRNVPEDLKRDFKAWCGGRDYTMENCVVALLRLALREDKPLPEARADKCVKDMEAGVPLHTRNVPPHLKAQFKAWCARRGYAMEDAVIALLRRTLRDDKPVPGAEAKARIGS